jgi:hypothetical protein
MEDPIDQYDEYEFPEDFAVTAGPAVLPKSPVVGSARQPHNDSNRKVDEKEASAKAFSRGYQKSKDLFELKIKELETNFKARIQQIRKEESKDQSLILLDPSKSNDSLIYFLAPDLGGSDAIKRITDIVTSARLSDRLKDGSLRQCKKAHGFCFKPLKYSWGFPFNFAREKTDNKHMSNVIPEVFEPLQRWFSVHFGRRGDSVMANYYPENILIGFGRHFDFAGNPMPVACFTFVVLSDGLVLVDSSDHIIEFYPNNVLASGSMKGTPVQTNNRQLTMAGLTHLITPAHGSVWVMDGYTNRHWTHRVPGRMSQYPRITITIRCNAEILNHVKLCRQLIPSMPDQRQAAPLASGDVFWLGTRDEDFGVIYTNKQPQSFKITPVNGKTEQVRSTFRKLSRFTDLMQNLARQTGRVHSTSPANRVLLYPSAGMWLFDALQDPDHSDGHNHTYEVIRQFCRSISLYCECDNDKCCEGILVQHRPPVTTYAGVGYERDEFYGQLTMYDEVKQVDVPRMTFPIQEDSVGPASDPLRQAYERNPYGAEKRKLACHKWFTIQKENGVVKKAS